MNDTAALDKIQELMSGKEWDAYTLDEIANIIRETGREIKDCNED